jgi:hypothetical protein
VAEFSERLTVREKYKNDDLCHYMRLKFTTQFKNSYGPEFHPQMALQYSCVSAKLNGSRYLEPQSLTGRQSLDRSLTRASTPVSKRQSVPKVQLTNRRITR